VNKIAAIQAPNPMQGRIATCQNRFSGMSEANDAPEYRGGGMGRRDVLALGGIGLFLAALGLPKLAEMRARVAPFKDQSAQIDGLFFRPPHEDRPNLWIHRDYTLPQSGRKFRSELVVELEPIPKGSEAVEFNNPMEFVEAASQAVRPIHFNQIVPRVEGLLAHMEREQGPNFDMNAFETALRYPWMDKQGKAQPALKNLELGNVTMRNRAYAVKIVRGRPG
jgi:hypothetical protein